MHKAYNILRFMLVIRHTCAVQVSNLILMTDIKPCFGRLFLIFCTFVYVAYRPLNALLAYITVY